MASKGWEIRFSFLLSSLNGMMAGISSHSRGLHLQQLYVYSGKNIVLLEIWELTSKTWLLSTPVLLSTFLVGWKTWQAHYPKLFCFYKTFTPRHCWKWFVWKPVPLKQFSKLYCIITFHYLGDTTWAQLLHHGSSLSMVNILFLNKLGFAHFAHRTHSCDLVIGMSYREIHKWNK